MADASSVVFRASYAQEALWLEDQLQASRLAYNVPLVSRLVGPLDSARLERAFAAVIARHESLRTTFRMLDGELCQLVGEPAAWRLIVDDLRDRADAAERARELVAREVATPFDLATGPLIRARLIAITSTEHLLCVAIHHIVSDGVSTGILLDELDALYRGATLPEPALHYGDYAEWQRQWLAGARFADQLAYWTRTLAGVEPLALATDRPRRARRTGAGRAILRALDRATAERLERTARELATTPQLVLLAAWTALLARHAQQADIAIGVPVALRKRAELARVIGFFVNTVVVRTRWHTEPTFAELVGLVRTAAAGAYAHDDLPFARLVEELRPDREAGRPPLFQAAFVYQDRGGARRIGELALDPVDVYAGGAKVELTLHAETRDGRLAFALEYATELFDDATAERLADHYERLLAVALRDPRRPISALELAAPAERARVAAWTTAAAADPATPLLGHVARWARERPEAVAVRDQTTALTYAALWDRAGRVASALAARGLGPGSIVGLYVDRTCDLVPALLGVWCAGAAYAPFDPGGEPARLRAAARNLAGIVVSSARLDEIRGIDAGALVELERALQQRPFDLIPESEAADLAYVIYTSGSTGEPKGVAISRGALDGYLAWAASAYAPREAAPRYAPVHSALAFDLTVTSLLLPLLEGGEVVLCDAAHPADALARALAEHPRECLVKLTPAHLEALLHLVPECVWAGVRGTFVVGGEALASGLVARLVERAPGVAIWNEYGPTEATVGCVVQRATGAETRAEVPIGRPVAGMQALVLDDALAPVPELVPGELYLAGPQLARGYVGAPAATARAFVPHPGSAAGERLYRTGDRVRWLPDGTLEFLGRLDGQVKLRGYRIELGEVEHALAAHPALAAAAAAVIGAGSERRLVGYAVVRAGAAWQPEVIRAWLAARLPAYLVPSQLVALPALPLTTHGKLDRRALPPPADSAPLRELAPPRTPTEAIIASIWCALLDRSAVGVHDDFFELGGHSLLATQLIARLRSLFRVELPLRAVFEAPTVAGLARRVTEAVGTVHAAAPPLLAVPRTGHDPVSYAQQRLWVLDRLEPGSARYTIAGAVRLRGALDVDALARAFAALVARHEALRTTFVTVAGEPRQVVHPPGGFALERVAPRDDLGALAGELVARPFDLETGPLVRASLVAIAPGDHLLVVAIHHIVADGWSMRILGRELAALYGGAELPPPRVHVADHAAHQRAWLTGDALDAQLAYWRGALAGIPTLLALPTDRPRPAVQSTRGAVVACSPSRELTAALHALARAEGATLFMVLAAGVTALLARYSAQSDIVIGTPIANRTDADAEQLIGCLANTLALRVDLAGRPSGRELIARVRDRALAAWAHQDAPFERVVDALAPARSLSYAPVFQVMLSVEDAAGPLLALPGVTATALDVEHAQVKLDLLFTFRQLGDELRGTIELSRDLFDVDTVERMSEALLRLLAQLAADPGARVDDLALLDADGRAQLAAWGRATTAAPATRLLHELVADQAARTPSAPAVICGRDRLDYAGLEARAEQLARALVRRGVGPDAAVALCVDRSLDMVVAVLAILRAGGAYVPIDPAYPPARRALMLADCGARVVVTQRRFAAELVAPHALLIDEPLDEPLDAAPRRTPRPDHLAYVIYTSGSTGTPKGVAVSHACAAAFVDWATSQFTPAQLARTLAATSLCFDLSVFELFAPLACGGTIVVADNALALPAVTEPITLLNTVPSALAALLAIDGVPASVRTVITAGEPLPDALVQRAYQLPHDAVWDLYGPTEVTVYSVGGVRARGAGSPETIGRPLPTTEALILDAALVPVPSGVWGELYLGGVQVARGYLGRPELTADRFTPHPAGAPGERVYRTGDRARWRSDGTIEYGGRADHQIKIRGFRVELGEIAAALEAIAGVAEAVAVAHRDAAAGLQLVAYVAGPAVPATAELDAALRRALPAYMVPAAYVALAALPRTASGKLDRAALPRPMLAAAGAPRTQPTTDAERAVVAIANELLGSDRAGLEDNFFELGGHSLLAAQLAARVVQRFGVALGLRAVFERTTLGELAAEVDKLLAAGARDTAAIPRLPRAGDALPASFAQERLWFLDRLEPGSPAYNIPVIARLRGELDVARLRGALTAVIERHEALRTRFAITGDRVVQRIGAAPVDPLEVVAAAAWTTADIDRAAAEHARAGFDLERDLPLRARLLVRSPTDAVLLLTVHHIAADGWSMHVLVDELGAHYGRSAALAPLPIQYADYAAWQRGRDLAPQLAYWRERLAGVAPLELPTDRRRAATISSRGAHAYRALGADAAARVRALAHATGATSFMVLLAAWAALLARYSGSRDLAIGTPIANRTRRDLEPLIGLCINTLVLRVDCDGGPRFRDLIERVRTCALGAFDHQDVPFERVVEELRPDRDLGRSPLFQVMFELATELGAPPAFDGLAVEIRDGDTAAVKVELALAIAGATGDQLTASLEYAADLYDAATADRLLAHFDALLDGALADPDRRICELELLPAELATQVGAWNATARELPSCTIAHQVFAARAAEHPHRLAATDARERLSYAELDARANGVACALLAADVQPEERIGLYGDRDVNLLAAILGVWKAGAAYVPVDPQYPAERVRRIVDRAACRFVIAGRDHAHAATAIAAGSTVLVLEDLVARGGADPGVAVAPQQLAYAIFTSGSTGLPKGAMVEQLGMYNHLCAKQEALELRDSDVIIQNASQCFDISVWQFVVGLIGGGRVHVVGPEAAYDAARLLAACRAEAATVLEVVPAVLRAIVELAGGPPPALRWMVVTGEALPPELTRRWFDWAPGVPLVNAYGPTECSDDVTHHILRAPVATTAAASPIGRPIINFRMYVLDAELRHQPIGVRGELYAAGTGVGRGYLSDPAQTAAVFVPDPFGAPGERMYRTGDVARWLPDGCLEFLGRIDHQVKLRGHRIELGEIEAVIAGRPGVAAAVVEVSARAGEPLLVAYVVLRAGATSIAELRTAAQAELPGYMVPAQWIELAALPLTPNGKLDRAALPAPARIDRTPAAAPRSPIEAQVLAVWRELFASPQLGIDDDFFELGGHSLLAAQLHARLTAVLGAAFPLRRIFEAPTVRQLMDAVLPDQLATAGAGARELVTELEDMTDEQALELLRRLAE